MDDFNSFCFLRCIIVCCEQILFSLQRFVCRTLSCNFDYLLLVIGITLETQLRFERIEIILIDTKPSIDHDIHAKHFIRSIDFMRWPAIQVDRFRLSSEWHSQCSENDKFRRNKSFYSFNIYQSR